MTYTVTLSNGNSLITVPDRTMLGPDVAGYPSNCSLNLWGRGAVNFGQATASNFVHLLENFSNPTAPLEPLVGQLWYDNAPGASSLRLFNNEERWVQVVTTGTGLFFENGDVYVYDDVGDSARLGCNGIITLIRADYRPRIIFEGVANATNAVTLELSTDSLGNHGLMINNGIVWNAGNLTPFDLNKNNTANGSNVFLGSLSYNGGNVFTSLGGTVNTLTVNGLAQFKASAVITGNVDLVANTTFPEAHLTIRAGSGKYSNLLLSNATGDYRWTFSKDASAETGGNAGSNFGLSCYSDSGSYITTPITIVRATGETTLNTPAYAVTPPTGDSSTRIATTAFVKAGTRQKLTANLNLYVSPAGSDANNGLSVGAPFRFMQTAWNYLLDSIDLNGYSVFIRCADGTYYEQILCDGMPVGSSGGPPGSPFFNDGYTPYHPNTSSITFIGNTANPAACEIHATNQSCIYVAGGNTWVNFQGFKLTGSGTIGNALARAVDGGELVFNGNMTFGYTTWFHMQCSGMARIYLWSNYTIDGGPTGGGTTGHIYCAESGGVLVACSVWITTSLTYSYFVVSEINSYVQLYDATGGTGTPFYISGTMTGARFLCHLNATIHTNTGNPSYLPGSTDVAPYAGGQYA